MVKYSFKDVLPEFPQIRHLPWKPNSKGDKIATEAEVVAALEKGVTSLGHSRIYVQEKIDGANCGMTFLHDHPVVRSRSKILRKGQPLKSWGQKQFASAWNWMHDRKDRFTKLNEEGPYTVYGEWMVQQHGMVYDDLPEWFVAYELYDYEKCHFVDPQKTDDILKDCGFTVIPFELHPIFFFTADIDRSTIVEGTLENFANKPSHFAKDATREGIVVKVSDGEWITDRFKMVRQGFEQGGLLSQNEMKRNSLK